jgi:hypothetical protein
MLLDLSSFERFDIQPIQWANPVAFGDETADKASLNHRVLHQ